MQGRLRRTAGFIALTTYGGREEAKAALARVRAIHHQVRGMLPDGIVYSAGDPTLLAWVHVAETTCFLKAWIRYAEPRMPAADQDRYFAEMAQIAQALGADPIPRSSAEARQLLQALRPQLRCDGRTREVARFLLAQPAPSPLAEPVQALPMQAAVDLLPTWARRMHGLPNPALAGPLIRAGTLGWPERCAGLSPDEPRRDPGPRLRKHMILRAGLCEWA